MRSQITAVVTTFKIIYNDFSLPDSSKFCIINLWAGVSLQTNTLGYIKKRSRNVVLLKVTGSPGKLSLARCISLLVGDSFVHWDEFRIAFGVRRISLSNF